MTVGLALASHDPSHSVAVPQGLAGAAEETGQALSTHRG
jgi:hypothetical protein